MGKVVCEICGSGSARPLMAKCVECSSYQHRYCMPVVAFSIPLEWLCSECQEKANGDPKPNQGGQNELQSACGMTNERETPKLDLGHSNVVHQINTYTRKRCSSAKVKFISSEEVALLNRDKRPYGRSTSAMQQSLARSMSPPSLKQYSYMKCTSSIKCVPPSRNGTQVRSPLKRSVHASHDKANIENRSEFATQKSQLPHASPPNVRQPSNTNCISPSRSDTQVHALRRCAAASHEARKKDLSMNKIRNPGHGSSIPMTNRSRTEVVVKGKVDSQIEDKTKEKKTVSADKGENISQIQHESREKEALCASVDATGCESEMKSPNHNIRTLLITDSSVAYSRRPSPTNCWTGCFLALDAGTKHNLGEFKAYFPSKVLPRIYDIANVMPTTLQLEMLPRMDDWPITFETSRPTYEDIGLFFFSNKFDWHEKKHPNPLETSCNYVMRAYINDIKLLIYPSELLPPDSQSVDGKRFLWGVFVRPKGKRSHRSLSSTST